MTSNSPSAKVRQEAAIWYDSLDELSNADYDAFLDWLDASPEHQEAFNKLETTALDPALLNAALELEQDIIAAGRKEERGSAIFSSLINVFKQQRAAFIGGTLACLAVFVGFNSLQVSQSPGDSVQTETYATLQSTTATHTLADGSKVTLNAASAVVTEFSSNERRINLNRGSAVFDVVNTPERPFIVQVDAFTTTALGTIYEVDRLNSAVEVRVLEGVVRVDHNGSTIQLVRAGEWLFIDNANNIRSGTLSDTSTVDWMSGWMQTEQTDLKYVVEKLNRYRSKPVRIANGEQLGDAPITGRFSLRDGDATLQLIAALQGIEILETPNETLLTSATEN